MASSSSTPSIDDPPLTSVSPTPLSVKPSAATSSPVKSEPPTPSTAVAATPRPQSSSDSDLVIHVPSYARWFSWDSINECEVRCVPEFFDSRSPSKNPKVYKYYRNSIIKYFRQNYSSGKVTFSEVRKTLVGDVGSIRRVFDFLETWSLINYVPNALNKPLKWEDKDSKSSASANGKGTSSASNAPAKRLCSGCQSVCTIACFVCEKYDLTLCARCYVRGNYTLGVNSTDFRRVEISEEISSEWTQKETIQLLEAVTHFGDDWKKVALHVPGRSEKDCVTHFLKLPVGEQFAGYTDLGELNNHYDQIKDSGEVVCRSDSDDFPSLSKRMRLTPLADASNPIMGQAAFLSALVGPKVAKAAAQAAVTSLSKASKDNLRSLSRNTREQGAVRGSNGNANRNEFKQTAFDADSTLEKEELHPQRISKIVEVEMKEIIEKVVHFEELDLLMEKERKQFDQMKDLLFIDQLTLLFHKRKSTTKTDESAEKNVRTD